MTPPPSAAPAAVLAPAVLAPAVLCCGRPMGAISVTEQAETTVDEVSLLSCSSCSRHAWLQDGVLLDRDGMLAAVKARIAVAPRPRGGRPKGSGRKTPAPAPRAEDEAVLKAREMRALLSGFTVHGTVR